MQIKEYLEEHRQEFEPWLAYNEPGRVEIKVLPYLQDIENGIFVEAGAMDGLFQSNTKILEDLGWTGLLIEPALKSAAKCRQNRKSLTVECALVSKDYKEETISGDFIFDGYQGQGAYSSVHRGAYGILTTEKASGREAVIDDKIKKSWHPFQVEVYANNLDSILAEYKIEKVDFFSLDIEGYEMEALKGVDFNRTPIKYMLIEVNTRDYSLKALETYLAPWYNKGVNISNFTKESTPGWPGDHQDYLFIWKS